MGEAEKQILDFLREEAVRIKYGKLLVEINVSDCRMTNIIAETRRSQNIDYGSMGVVKKNKI